MNAICLNFDKAATVYQENAFLQKQMSSALIDWLPPQKGFGRIVDLGCATGESLCMLEKKYPRATFWGIDFSPAMLKEAKKKSSRITWHQADLQDFKLEENFDLIFSNAVLQWLDDISICISHWSKYLMPRGWMALGAFLEQTLEELKDAWGSLPGRRWMGPKLPGYADVKIAIQTSKLSLMKAREWKEKVFFDDLRQFHLLQKRSGTRAPGKGVSLSPREYRMLEEKLSRGAKISLTYHIGLFMAKKDER